MDSGLPEDARPTGPVPTDAAESTGVMAVIAAATVTTTARMAPRRTGRPASLRLTAPHTLRTSLVMASGRPGERAGTSPTGEVRYRR